MRESSRMWTVPRSRCHLTWLLVVSREQLDSVRCEIPLLGHGPPPAEPSRAARTVRAGAVRTSRLHVSAFVPCRRPNRFLTAAARAGPPRPLTGPAADGLPHLWPAFARMSGRRGDCH